MKSISLLLFMMGFVLVFSHPVSASTEQSENIQLSTDQESWKFRVLLNDTPIGFHHVNISDNGMKRSVHTTASFDVRFLLIPVYNYEHETRETWQGDCLASIESTTDDNGDDYFINGSRESEAINLITQDGTVQLNGCVRTFAYWDVNLLKAERLLNTQTGEYQIVEIKDLGIGELLIDESSVQARHFRLVCEDRTIDLWYGKNMRWLALESETESGDLLRYLPEESATIKQELRS